MVHVKKRMQKCTKKQGFVRWQKARKIKVSEEFGKGMEEIEKDNQYGIGCFHDFYGRMR